MDAPITLKCGIVNCFLVGSGKFALVDAGYPGMEDRIEKAIKDAGIDPALISLIVITHAHIDHYGSAEALRKKLKVPIACSREDAGDIEKGVNRHLTPVGITGRIASIFAIIAAFSRKGESSPCALAPDILFSGPASLQPWGVDASVVPCAGHTPGSIAVVPGGGAAAEWEASGGRAAQALPWAVIGDLAFGRFTASRRARLPIFAADRASLHENLRRFSGALTAYVGHGGPLKGEELRKLAAEADFSLN